MTFFIRYRPDDGEIIGWGSGHEPDPLQGTEVLFVEPFDPDPTIHKCDGAGVVFKSEAETRQARLPSLRAVQEAVFLELCRTDAEVMPDRPVAKDWADYRQALRNLSKQFTDPVEMVDAWPVAPDGSDPIQHLRARL
jgi:Phage tail assembly chaperone protein